MRRLQRPAPELGASGSAAAVAKPATRTLHRRPWCRLYSHLARPTGQANDCRPLLRHHHPSRQSEQPSARNPVECYSCTDKTLDRTRPGPHAGPNRQPVHLFTERPLTMVSDRRIGRVSAARTSDSRALDDAQPARAPQPLAHTAPWRRKNGQRPTAIS